MLLLPPPSHSLEESLGVVAGFNAGLVRASAAQPCAHCPAQHSCLPLTASWPLGLQENVHVFSRVLEVRVFVHIHQRPQGACARAYARMQGRIQVASSENNTPLPLIALPHSCFVVYIALQAASGCLAAVLVTMQVRQCTVCEHGVQTGGCRQGADGLHRPLGPAEVPVQAAAAVWAWQMHLGLVPSAAAPDTQSDTRTHVKYARIRTHVRIRLPNTWEVRDPATLMHSDRAPQLCRPALSSALMPHSASAPQHLRPMTFCSQLLGLSSVEL